MAVDGLSAATAGEMLRRIRALFVLIEDRALTETSLK
jgi:hypothetical protein